MADRHELRIPGIVAGSREFRPVHAPYSGEVIAEVERADAAAAGAALDAAASLFADRSTWLPVHERIGILRRAAAAMAARDEELALQIALEGGKPLTDARVEVARAVNGLELCAEEAGRLEGESVPMGATAASAGRMTLTTREPIGVVMAVSAFNHPLNLVVHQVGPAVAAGCPVIVKPATATPLSCLAVAQILSEAGLPDGWCTALPCDSAVAEPLVTSDRIGFLSFIGSAAVGWGLRSKIAPGVRCALEHGGVAPLIVAPDADLERAVPAIIKGGYYHAGQVCVSVQRVFVHESIKVRLVELLTEGIARLRTGDPTDPATDVGPLITDREVARVDDWVREAVAGGATVAAGGRRLNHQCYEPTLLVDTPADAKAMRDEVFGPVVNVVGCEDLASAIAAANDLPWAFQAAIFTQDLETALAAGSQLDATAVMVNDHTAFRVDWMPFAGRGPSGLGVGGIPWTLHEMTRLKMVVLNPARP